MEIEEYVEEFKKILTALKDKELALSMDNLVSASVAILAERAADRRQFEMI